MAAISSTVRRLVGGPLAEVVEVYYQTRDDVDGTSNDTFTVTLADVGISPTGLLAVEGWEHTTSGSVIVVQVPTTSVSAGVLTVTMTGSNSNNVFVIKIVGLGETPTYVA